MSLVRQHAVGHGGRPVDDLVEVASAPLAGDVAIQLDGVVVPVVGVGGQSHIGERKRLVH